MNTAYDFDLEQEDFGAELGDPRRCSRHPEVKTSSNDGLFDAAGCDRCEAEAQDAADEEAYAAEVATLFGFGRLVALSGPWIEVKVVFESQDEIQF